MRYSSISRLAAFVSSVVIGWTEPILLAADAGEVIPHRQDSVPNKPYSPAAAIEHMTVPPGFTVELVASEPDIVNPIAMAFDDRGRIWITESVEYPRKPAGVGRDRVKILEDTSGNGRADKVTVFAEGLNIPTGVAVGHGGVWVLNSPNLLFLRESDGKEQSRQVVVTGFGRTDTHELPNSLTWGPDGWLYGLNGVFNESRVRSNNGKEYKFTCALWRVHPETHEFQVVCEGTSNPYGIAWDTEGSAIVEACHWANDHLFHFVETGIYQRQAGAYPPFAWKIGSITDHGHQKTAYCGISFLDTDAYPAAYRERVCVGNIHGGCLNLDRLERDGSTYLAKGEADLLNANDAWFMPVALALGPDGCLYVLDWYDRYHCYQDANRDPEGIDRANGRLYRLRYQGTPRAPRFDLASETDARLIERLGSGNLYFRQSAQRLLTERLMAKSGAPSKRASETAGRLRKIATDGTAPRKTRLHALWALIGSASLGDEFHRQLLGDADAAIRAWAVRAAGNYGKVSPEIQGAVSSLSGDASPDVQLQVAIAARKIDGLDALPLLVQVLARCGQDKLIPAICWQNLHPLLETESARFVNLVKSVPAKMNGVLAPALEILLPRAAERMALAKPLPASALGEWVELAVEKSPVRANECLSAISAQLTGLDTGGLEQLKQRLQPILTPFLSSRSSSPLSTSAQLLAARLKIAEVNPADIRRRLVSAAVPEAARLQALGSLIAFRDPTLLEIIPKLLAGADGRFASQVLAAAGAMDDPKLADVLLAQYSSFPMELRPLVVEVLMQREPWARKILDAVLAKKLAPSILNANYLRKIMESNDREALWAVEKAFGTVRSERDPAREKVVAEMTGYLRTHPGDPHSGQKVFRNFCAQCHVIYGEGGNVGPDLTANGRGSFEQLVSSVFDPSLVIGPGYQVTTVVTKDGRNLTGLIAEDNEQRLVLRMPGEGQEAVPRNNVKYTRMGKLSMMPEGIETLLDKRDITDLFAFLALDKPPGDATAKPIPGAVVSASSQAGTNPDSRRLKLEKGEKTLTVRAKLGSATEWIDLITCVTGPDLRPYLHPVRDPSGKVVLTDDKPSDHPWQHGIFTGFHGLVDGHEYWMENDGRLRFARLLETSESENNVRWRWQTHFLPPKTEKIAMEEETAITVHTPQSTEGYEMEYDFTLRALDRPVLFTKAYVGGLAVRMPWDKSNPRQSHLNSNGERGRNCERQRASWCTVERPFGDQVFGVAVFSHPKNAEYPPVWRVDEQGLINPSVTALGDWQLAPGEAKIFRQHIVVYKGSASPEWLKKKFEDYVAGLAATTPNPK